MATTITHGRTRGHPRPSIFHRILACAVDSRQRQARRQVNALLLGLDDAALASFGGARRTLDEACRGPLPL